jgi:hypothetical protein
MDVNEASDYVWQRGFETSVLVISSLENAFQNVFLEMFVPSLPLLSTELRTAAPREATTGTGEEPDPIEEAYLYLPTYVDGFLIGLGHW